MTTYIHPSSHQGHKTEYNEEFDCYYCVECNEWLENKCSNPQCDYCSNRPEKPNDCA